MTFRSSFAVCAQAALLLNLSSTFAGSVAPLPPPSLSWIQKNILVPKCVTCHSAKVGDGDGLVKANFDSLTGVLAQVQPGLPETSPIYRSVKDHVMPKPMGEMDPAYLNDDELGAISGWISAGAQDDGFASFEVQTVNGNADGTCSPAALQIPAGKATLIQLKTPNDHMFAMISAGLGINTMAMKDMDGVQLITPVTAGSFPFSCGIHGTETSGSITVR